MTTTTSTPSTPAIARTHGIHHVTGISGDAQRTLDFYAGVLGLRLVKRTVNFDDPGTYHFYFGDGDGTPGSVLTFFPWGDAPRGRVGTGQVAAVALSIPPAALGAWLERLGAHGIRYDGPTRRLGGEQVVAFRDPDGLLLELVPHPAAAAVAGWDGGPVAPEHAIRGVHAVTLWVESHAATAEVLTARLGLHAVADDGATFRFAAGDPAAAPRPGAIVDVREVGGFWRGTTGVGSIHHVAFRAVDDEHELALRRQVMAAGISVTGQLDRTYFHSVYFREPGGVLFELATDGPGFAIDETPDALGSALMLPPQYEPSRAEIERALPTVHHGVGSEA